MTREDALNKTIGILTYHQVNFCKSKEAVANMNEIIDALEKIDQECVADKDTNVTTTDCISRQAVLELQYRIDDSATLSARDVVNVEDIEDLPSVTPLPKMGRWEWNQYDANPKIGNFHCSLCHNIGRTYYDYCPGCGAEMSEIPTGTERSEE